MAPSDNASGAFDGEAHISRRGRPGLRLTVWRAVWPMLIHNPVMAAKYQAMTAAADQAAAGARDDGAGRAGHATAAAEAARRRRARAPWRAPPRCCAGSTPSWSMAPAGTLTSPSAAKTTRLPPATWRQPDQRIPHHVTGALDQAFPPDEGRASPPRRRGPTSCDTLGSSPLVARSFSPARLNAVGAGLHGRARLHYAEREAPGHKAPALPHHPGTSTPARVGGQHSMPANGPPPATTADQGATGASGSNTRPGQRHRSKINN